MSLFDVCALLLAGFAASAVNAVAGGGSLITFPTLLAIGLPPVSANVTNALAVAPGYFASVYGSRTDLAEVADRRGRGELLRLLPTALVGTAHRLRAPARDARPGVRTHRAVSHPRCRCGARVPTAAPVAGRPSARHVARDGSGSRCTRWSALARCTADTSMLDSA